MTLLIAAFTRTRPKATGSARRIRRITKKNSLLAYL